MNKFLSICLAGLILSSFQVSATFAKSAPLEIEKSQVVNYGYALFAQRKFTILSKIQSIQLQLNNNPKDAQKWNELGCLYSELGTMNETEGSFDEALDNYKEAINAFDKAIKLEPNNSEFRKNRDDAVEKLRDVAANKRKNADENEDKNITPNFDGLG